MSKADKIQEIIRKNNLRGDVEEQSESVVTVDIRWGDWKHEHGRLRYLVGQEMPELKKVESYTTEDDGSDCYSAIHWFYF